MLKEQAILAGKDKIIDHIPNRAPIHSWRRDFAKGKCIAILQEMYQT